jgi:hypothetical protein
VAADKESEKCLKLKASVFMAKLTSWRQKGETKKQPVVSLDNSITQQMLALGELQSG